MREKYSFRLLRIICHLSVAKEKVKSGTPFLHFLRSSHWSVINRGKRNASFTVFAVCCRLTQTLKSSDTSSGFNGEPASVRSRGGFQPQYYVYTDVKYQGHNCSGFQHMLYALCLRVCLDSPLELA